MLYDVIIIGAGPAGSTCARECATRGLTTLLLDRAAFPRPKPCGGALSARALSRLGFPLPPGLIEQECFGVRVHYGPDVAEVRTRERISAMVSRERLDVFLVEKAKEAGAEFRQNVLAIELVTANDRVEVRTAKNSYQGRYVVGADGANGIVSKTIRPVYSRNEIMAAIVSSVPMEIGKQSDMLEMHFGIAPEGYGWVFPHGNYNSVGVMGLARDFSNANQCLVDFARSQNILLDSIKGHTIPMGGFKRKLALGRVLLAGDAAGFADPFHGEGMGNSIYSGILAGRAIAGQRDDPTACGRCYERACNQLIVKEMRIALTMSRMLERSPRFFITLFFRHRKTLEQYVDIALGKSDYIRFRRWVLLRLPLFLAFHGAHKLFPSSP